MTQEKKTILVLLVLIGTIAFIYLKFSKEGPSPAVVTMERLNTLETEVIAYSANNNGVIPSSLDNLDLPKEATLDHKDVPFVLDVDGRAVTITSFGADGKPGGLMFNADHKVEFLVPEN